MPRPPRESVFEPRAMLAPPASEPIVSLPPSVRAPPLEPVTAADDESRPTGDPPNPSPCSLEGSFAPRSLQASHASEIRPTITPRIAADPTKPGPKKPAMVRLQTIKKAWKTLPIQGLIEAAGDRQASEKNFGGPGRGLHRFQIRHADEIVR